MNKLWTNYEQNMNKQMFEKIKLKSDYLYKKQNSDYWINSY